MTERLTTRTVFAAVALLAACSQGQSAPSAAPEPPAYGTTTGELACDAYVAHARACIEKGRMAGLVQRRAELAVVERTLQGLVGGETIALEKRDVWGSAVRASRARKRVEGAMLAGESDESVLVSLGKSPKDLVLDQMPPAELCKRGFDQLPAECQ